MTGKFKRLPEHDPVSYLILLSIIANTVILSSIVNTLARMTQRYKHIPYKVYKLRIVLQHITAIIKCRQSII